LEAEVRLDEALRELRKLGFRWREAWCLTLLADIFDATGRESDAAQTRDQAAAILRRIHAVC